MLWKAFPLPIAVREKSRAQLVMLLCSLVVLLGSIQQAAAAQAPAPSSLPTLGQSCPSTYKVQPNDTYCIISTKTGVSVARLMAANPSIPLAGVSAGQAFMIPCKPELNCCPLYLYSAPNGTGLIDIAKLRPDLTVPELVAANPNNVNVNATFVRCGSEVRVPCLTGSPSCTGVGYAPTPAPGSVS